MQNKYNANEAVNFTIQLQIKCQWRSKLSNIILKALSRVQGDKEGKNCAAWTHMS